MSRRPPPSFLHRRLARVAALAGLLAALWLAASTWGERWAVARLGEQAEAALTLSASVLRAEIDKQRSVPIVLAEDPDVRQVLEGGGEAARLALSRRLASLAATTQASVLYLVDREGWTVSASNFSEPTSFVGSSFRFRRYFEGALADGAAEQYALGTVSRRPGLYISRRVAGTDGAALGVVVAKVELSGVEAVWATTGNLVFASDERGVVLATGQPDWRYRTLAPVPADRAADIRDSLQFAAASLAPLPLRADGRGTVRAPGDDGGERFVEATMPLGDATLSWRLHLLMPARGAIRSARWTAGLQAGALGAVAVALASAALRRRRRARREAVRLRDEAAELERKVGERTADLEIANRRLQGEIERRETSDRQVASLRVDLEQAGRLSFLGQITAGVAHEIAQPVGAIRAFAENAERFLAMGESGPAGTNMRRVVALTERIGTITETLRGFSRRGAGDPEAIAVGEAVAGSRLLLQHRLDRADIRLAVHGDAGTLVRAERVRLEQVLVNLVGNAIEALEGRPGGRVDVQIVAAGDEVAIEVRDDGPGLAPEVLASIFVPFRTTKPRGTGLGLVISRDIVAEWGGTLTAANGPDGGAVFTLLLRRTDP